ncbi:hypothetical protein F0562_002667 [Nyssa sinensis]|uniref:Uncharacterized protein n=1 Tax=Nyssa sinensis TaxID=561372 RepID=A0A5J5BVD9_9ASTE|nr:hypothetical protein F0562_002667 [Nyssa sinensis]
MKVIVPCKVALLVVVILLFCSLLVLVEAAKSAREDTSGADATPSSHGNDLYATKEDEHLDEGDSLAVDYTPARKRTPIHN